MVSRCIFCVGATAAEQKIEAMDGLTLGLDGINNELVLLIKFSDNAGNTTVTATVHQIISVYMQFFSSLCVVTVIAIEQKI